MHESRKTFEQWLLDTIDGLEPDEYGLQRSEDGRYCSRDTDYMWDAWQAAWNHPNRNKHPGEPRAENATGAQEIGVARTRNITSAYDILKKAENYVKYGLGLAGADGNGSNIVPQVGGHGGSTQNSANIPFNQALNEGYAKLKEECISEGIIPFDQPAKHSD